MDNESQATIAFLQTLVEVHQSLDLLAKELNQRTDVKKACVHPFAPRGHLSGEYDLEGLLTIGYSNADFGVSALLESGYCVDWWLALDWNESNWRLRCDVLSNNTSDDGSCVVIPFPEFMSTSMAELTEHLKSCVLKLRETVSEESLFA